MAIEVIAAAKNVLGTVTVPGSGSFAGETVEAKIIDKSRKTVVIPWTTQADGGNANWANRIVEVVFAAADANFTSQFLDAELYIRVTISTVPTIYRVENDVNCLVIPADP